MFEFLKFSNVISKLVFIAKLLGQAIYKYPSDSIKISYVGVFMLCLFLAKNLFSGGLFLAMSFYYKGNETIKHEIIIHSLLTFSIGISNFITFIIIITNIFMSKRIFQVLKDLEELDKKVNRKI